MVGVILGHARSGSSELTRAVVDATGVRSMMEPFHRPMNERGIKFGHHGFKKYLDEVMGYHLIKHMWNGLSKEQNTEVLTHPDVYGVVFIYRRDAVQAALSTVVAQMTKRWRGTQEHIPEPLPLDEIASKAGMYESGRELYLEWLSENSIPYISVSYEELFVRDESARRDLLKKACNTLGLKINNLDLGVSRLSPNNRYNSDSIYRTASNWNEFEERFLR